VVIIPNSPDGRDLAPRLADQLGRTLLAGAIEVGPAAVTCARWGSLVLEVHQVEGPIVATLQPGVRGIAGFTGSSELRVEPLSLELPDGVADAEVLEVLPPDVTTMDLADAPRILAGGAGLGDSEEFALLGRVAKALGASVGATRVVTDAGLVGHERQIGTTGVAVQPRLYVALGISGAVQHTSGLGDPQHIVSVNTDPHCPMMAMADVAVVTDAPAVLQELASRLGVGDE
jgi:electron transfer flavoprotein alpha subunit